MKNAKTVQKVKKTADKYVSEWVRRKYSDKNGIASCYTCGKKAHWKQLQCGHFVSRNNSATRYFEDNLRVQCAGCNVWGRGRYDVYADKLLEELGTKRFKELLKKGRSIHQLTVQELEIIIEKAKVEIQKKEKDENII